MCQMKYCQHSSPMWPSFEQPLMKCLFSSMIQKLHFCQEDCLNLISTFYASYQNLTKSVLKRFSRYFRSFKRGHLGSHPYLGLVRVAKVKYFKLERHSSEVFSCFFLLPNLKVCSCVLMKVNKNWNISERGNVCHGQEKMAIQSF